MSKSTLYLRPEWYIFFISGLAHVIVGLLVVRTNFFEVVLFRVIDVELLM